MPPPPDLLTPGLMTVAVSVLAAFMIMGGLGAVLIEAAATKPFGFAPFWPGAGAGGHLCAH